MGLYISINADWVPLNHQEDLFAFGLLAGTSTRLRNCSVKSDARPGGRHLSVTLRRQGDLDVPVARRQGSGSRSGRKRQLHGPVRGARCPGA